MKIILAPASFKECMSAQEVAEALERGVMRAQPDCECVKIPVADGGEGTVAALVGATAGEYVRTRVTGPLGDRHVLARYGMLGNQSAKTAVIEMAAASGLVLVPARKRNPLLTTTYGTGELIRAALDRGARRIIVGVGGSATVDGGAGMAQALGVRLLDGDGRQIPFGGGALAGLARIDATGLDPRARSATIEVASDVRNPLAGENGAARVYGPQKGATPQMVADLDANLQHMAAVAARDLGVEIAEISGAGAAGGLGAGLVAFLGARMRPGFDVVAEMLRLDERLVGDLVITGEGRMDAQSLHGKAPIGVAVLAQKRGIPVVAVVGSLGQGWEAVLDSGIDACFSVADGPMPLARAMREAPRLVERCAEPVVRLFAAGRYNRTLTE